MGIFQKVVTSLVVEFSLPPHYPLTTTKFFGPLKMRQVPSSIILASVISLAMGISIQQSPNEKWQVFKDTYGKIYSESENRFRMQVFLDNIRLIEQHNARHAKGEVSYTLAMNKYGDMLPHEFASIMTGYKSERNRKDRKASTFVKPLNVEIPDSIDWFAK